jgi:DNA-binding HxlR family transcriptional regulator
MMAALDLLGQRWTLRVIWELQNEPAGFRELRRRCDDMSSSMLAKRLRELEDAGLVTTGDDGAYQLTELGRGLGPALEPLRSWAGDWAAAMGAGDGTGSGEWSSSSIS